MELKDILKAYRENNRISLRDFSASSGLSKSYILCLEKGEHPTSHKPIIPSIDTVERVAKGMHISTEQLLSQMDGRVVAEEQDDSMLRLLAYWELLNTEEKDKLTDFAYLMVQAKK